MAQKPVNLIFLIYVFLPGANPAAMMAMMQMMQGGKDKDKGSRYTPY